MDSVSRQCPLKCPFSKQAPILTLDSAPHDLYSKVILSVTPITKGKSMLKGTSKMKKQHSYYKA